MNKQTENRNPTRRILFAILLIGVGCLVIAEKTGILTTGIYHIVFSWQMLLIALGILFLSARRGGVVPGVILIVIGGIFLLPEVISLPIKTNQLLWPAIIIAIGFIILFKGFQHPDGLFKGNFGKGTFTDTDYINANLLFGGGEYMFNSDNFKGGKISAIFGGGKYDLRKAKLCATQTNILEISIIFGGIELLIPGDWNIKVEVDSILGGFSHKKTDYSTSEIDPSKVLIIRGTVIFGGGEIKRF